MDKVLITGMSGRIGSAVGRQLEGKYELSALNRRLVPGVPTCQADIADMEAIRPAFEGIDAVVHHGRWVRERRVGKVAAEQHQRGLQHF